MDAPTQTPEEHAESSVLPRIFLHDTAWRICCKTDSEREYCYMAAPGQDYHHRLGVGELYVESGEERICVPCASRRGLISHELKALQPKRGEVKLNPSDDVGEFDLAE